jgi:hypothetical protein
MENYGGLIELCVVFGFALAWAALELLGWRMDKEREAQKGSAGQHETSSSERARHPERQ